MNVLETILAAIGGTTVITGLSAWLGKVWAARILEKDRHKHATEIKKLKDQLQLATQMTLKQRDHFFNLSVTSHMATVAFDKHVAFCEEYIDCFFNGVKELFRDGPTVNALNVARELGLVCLKHAPWVPPDVIKNLKFFEDMIKGIGSTSVAIHSGAELPDRANDIKKMLNDLLYLIGQPDSEGKVDRQKGIDQVILLLQDLLGVSELTRLRSIVAQRAIQDSN
jgi:hypothetical protein